MSPLPVDAIAPPNRIRGVFSTQVAAVIGHGTTRRRTTKEVLVFIEEQPDGQLVLQPLNTNFVPSGETRRISKDQLLEDYVPEPAVYMDKVYPAIRNLTKTVARAERHYRRGETYSAEFEFKNALRIDEENIRATFGLGLTYLERGETDKGDLVFRRLVRLKATFEKRHKHLFNEFGIQLRKNKMYIQALKYYARAFKLARDDDHLLYNMARTFFEKGSHRTSAVFLRKALEINPELHEAKDLLELVKKKARRKSKEGKRIIVPI